MAQHVLVAVDDSNQSTEALEFACTEYPEATITALYVLDPGDFYAVSGIEGTAMANYDEVQGHHEERAENILETAREQAAEHGASNSRRSTSSGAFRDRSWITPPNTTSTTSSSAATAGRARVESSSAASQRRSPVGRQCR